MAIPNGRIEFKTEGGKMDERHLDVVVGRPVVEAAPRRVSLRTALPGGANPCGISPQIGAPNKSLLTSALEMEAMSFPLQRHR